MNKTKVVLNKNADKIIEKLVSDSVKQNGLDISCPECGKQIHLSFSGDVCQFCGLTIEYGIEPNV